jgi:hypothetical protein
VAFLVGGDAWTMWGVYQHMQTILQAELEKNRKIAAEVLTAETLKMREQIQSRLSHEFETPRLQQLIAGEARRYTANEAQTYIAAQVEAGLKPFQSQVRRATNDLELLQDGLQQYQKQSKADYQKLTHATAASEKLTEKLSEQIELGHRRDRIAGLEADAINEGGDRASFDILTRIANDPSEAKDIQGMAASEVSRIKAFGLHRLKQKASNSNGRIRTGSQRLCRS